MIQLPSINSEHLKEVGFYLLQGSKKGPICRKRKIWYEIKSNFTKDSILPTTKDYVMLSGEYYAHISALVEICNKLQCVFKVKSMLEIRAFEIYVCLDLSYGSKSCVKNENTYKHV